MKKEYHVESYWSDVAKRIRKRSESGFVAGDDEPFYTYKRIKFLKLLRTLDFEGKRVLEIGCGPGGNLLEVYKENPKELTGADISSEMIALAKLNCPPEINIVKVDGSNLPFEKSCFDISFTATVLQHNTDIKTLTDLIGEICRVTKERVYFFERIEKDIRGDELNQGRPVKFYEELMVKNGFKLNNVEFININISYLASGLVRKLLNPKSRKEGEPLNKLSITIQKLFLPITKLGDKVFPAKRDLAMLEFNRVD